MERVGRLVEEGESHVVVGLLLGLRLLLLGGGGSSGGGTSGSGSWGGSSSDVGDQVLNGLLLQELGEEWRPVGLDVDAGGLDDGVDLISLQCVPSTSEPSGSESNEEGRKKESETPKRM